ncbi:Ger(x)C family spore germination protein [Halalkalibacter alkalisediminis]|uniref:Ger(X)C family spore germination protein n=1 Tax=Halalkalibacter alkalisediminis TaxID=935616 RepID=A0ABV6NJB8_9BACI|nr:Ger(x)C family spore germination protein [Halalkalibacter alkalisediminis]
MKGITLSFLLVCLFMLSGCWDLTEIEQLSFVIGTALDPVDDEEIKARYQKETGRPLPKEMFQVTNQVVIPGLIEGGGEGGGSPAEGPFFNIRSTGMTNFKINRNFTSRRSRVMNYEHVKVVLINEELAREGIIESVIDFFARDHAMRRDFLVLISKGSGYEILENKLPLEIMPAISIEMMSNNTEKGHSIPPKKYIGELINNVASHQSYIIPRITKTGGDGIKLAGAAVFFGRENKMVGWLGEYDIQGYGWVTGEVENEAIEAFYGPEQKPFVFETDSGEVKVDYQHENGKDLFTITIMAEGFFVDNWIGGIDLDTHETISKLEQEVANEIKRQSTKVIEKMQNEFYTDIFQLHDEVRIHENSYWQEVKDRWDGEDGAFSKAEINLEVDVEIRHYMTTAELEEN